MTVPRSEVPRVERVRPERNGPRAEIGPAVPLIALRVVVAVLGTGLSILLLPGGYPLLGLGFALVAAARPRVGATWALVLVLAAAQALRDPATVGGEVLLLLVAVHVLVVLNGLTVALPARGRVELAALVPTARTLVLVQVPLQIAGLLVLALLHGGVVAPAAAVVGGVLLVAATAVLVRRLLAPPV